MAEAGRTLPIQDAHSRTFWTAAAEGRLLIQRSPASGRPQWPPRPHVVSDPGESPDWAEASGRGVVYSYSVVHRSSFGAPATPYVLALVRLEEGVTVLSNLIDVPPTAVRIGLPVRMTFETVSEAFRLPVFTTDPNAPVVNAGDRP